uniref:MitMem_reg domain-containing protein n=1 Tax=Heterorhabditis bacteriophora TaxID=37862 RepID=A0A1I7XBH4_HETBA
MKVYCILLLNLIRIIKTIFCFLNLKHDFVASPGPSSEGEGDASSQPSDSATTISSVQSAMPTLMANQPATTHQMQVCFPLLCIYIKLECYKLSSLCHKSSLLITFYHYCLVLCDELDADLVDYMVTVKQADPHGHLTASQALVIAKQYILEKLNNLNSMTTGGNFMADVMAQNILNQHMMMSMNQVKQETTAEELKEQPGKPCQYIFLLYYYNRISTNLIVLF